MSAGVRRSVRAALVSAAMMSSLAIPGTAPVGGMAAWELPIVAPAPPSGAAVGLRGAPSGLVSWWRGEDDASDETGENPGIERDTVRYTDGIVGRAFRFGGDGYIEVPTPFSLEPVTVTVMAWIRGPRPVSPGTYVISKGAVACNGNSSYALFTRVDTLHFFGSDGVENITLSPSPRGDIWDGFWHHVVGVYDGSSVRLYVDGLEQRQGNRAAFAAINYDFSDNRSFHIGAYVSSCKVLVFPGDMDEVRVFSRALGADEIRAIHDSERYVAELDWDEPVDEPLAPPQNLSARLVGAGSTPSAAPSGARRGGAVTAYKVYRSANPNTPPSPATFFTSVPPTETATRAPVEPGGSFFVVTAEYDQDESDPSNEAGAGGAGANVRRLRVKPTRVVIKGTGFTDTVVVVVDGIPFAAPATVSEGTKVLQATTLITGMSLAEYLATKRRVEFAVINSDQTITRVPYSVP
jgi:hypothetical protein